MSRAVVNSMQDHENEWVNKAAQVADFIIMSFLISAGKPTFQ